MLISPVDATPQISLFQPEDLPEFGKSTWKVHVLPGGRMPHRGSDNANGYDIYTRAVVSLDPDPQYPERRKTLFAFESWCDSSLQNCVHRIDDEWVYMLQPNEYVRIGLGIIMELPVYLTAFVHPRGNMNNSLLELCDEWKPNLEVFNGGVPIDSDFRGEPSALIRNRGKKPYPIRKYSRIVQVVRRYVDCSPPVDSPELVTQISDLTPTKRGFKQNGSSGFGI